MSAERLVDLVIVLSIFLLVFGVWQAMVLFWSSRRLRREQRIEERLGLGITKGHGPDGVRVLRLWHDGREVTTEVAAVTGLAALHAGMQDTIRRAGWSVSPEGFLARLGAAAILIFALCFALTQRVMPAAVTSLAVLFIFNAWMQHRINRRAALFERQFLDALQVVVSSLRAGHPVNGAFRFASMEIAAPVGEIFAEMCHQQEFGASLEEVVRDAAERTANDDVRLFATSVVVHSRSGGNLADMMERLAGVVRDRMGVTRRVRVLTAQTQFSKRVLLALPVVLFAVYNLINPEYMEPLYALTVGRVLLGVSAAMMLIGAWVMKRMVVIDF